jgi:hypothetical protein
MSSYTDRFGTGAMPTFNIGQGQGNTSWKYGGDESAAMMQDHLDQRAREYAEQKAAFQDTTMPALKAMFNPDEPEKDPMDAYLDEEAAAIAAAEEEAKAKALDSHAAAVQAMTDDHAYRGTWEGHLGGADESGALIGPGGAAAGLASFFSGPLAALIAGGSALHDKYTKIDPHLREKIQEADPEAFTSHEREDATWKDKFSDYWMNLGGFQYNLADGGRVGMNTGGLLPWTQTMDSDYANQYYNQFNDPVYTATQGATTPTNPTTPDPTLGDLGSMGSINPAVPLSGGLAQQRGRGPEDRDPRFTQGAHPEYGGFPGGYRPVGYEAGEDGVLRASYVPDNLENVSKDDEAHPFLQGVYDVGQLVPKTTSFLTDLLGFGKGKDDKAAEAEAFAQETLQKAQDERFQFEQNRAAAALAAQQQQQEEKAAEEAEQQYFADTWAAINSGGEGSDSDNTTQTSTSTGSGGSPLAGGVSLGTSLHGGNQYTGGGSHGGGPHSGGSGSGSGSGSGGGGGPGPKKKGRRQRKKGSHGGGPHG